MNELSGIAIEPSNLTISRVHQSCQAGLDLSCDCVGSVSTSKSFTKTTSWRQAQNTYEAPR